MTCIAATPKNSHFSFPVAEERLAGDSKARIACKQAPTICRSDQNGGQTLTPDVIPGAISQPWPVAPEKVGIINQNGRDQNSVLLPAEQKYLEMSRLQ